MTTINAERLSDTYHPLPERRIRGAMSERTLKRVTNNAPPYPGLPRNSATRDGAWSRMRPGPKAAIIITALLLPCFGGMAAIGAFVATQGAVETPDKAPAARQLADADAATTPTTPAATTTTVTPAATTVPTTPLATTVAPVIEKRSVVETERIPYSTRRVRDSSLARGATRVRTNGVAGVKTLTYEVTIINGKETGRKLLSTVIKKPVTKVVVVGAKPKPEKPRSNCDPNYSGCVPIASDVDCAGGTGNGPAYVSGPVKVIGSDIYRLDHDSDGYGCDD